MAVPTPDAAPESDDANRPVVQKIKVRLMRCIDWVRKINNGTDRQMLRLVAGHSGARVRPLHSQYTAA